MALLYVREQDIRSPNAFIVFPCDTMTSIINYEEVQFITVSRYKFRSGKIEAHLPASAWNQGLFRLIIKLGTENLVERVEFGLCSEIVFLPSEEQHIDFII